MDTLTERQSAVLHYIVGYIQEHLTSPTYREVGHYFAINERAAYEHVEALINKGYVRKQSGIPRSLMPTEKTQLHRERAVIYIPLVGTIAAGQPILAEENIEDMIAITDSICSYPTGIPHFALRVQGDSMRDAGVMPGDIALIRKQEYATTNDIVVAKIHDGITLKRFINQGGRVCLKSENPNYGPIFTTHLTIIGKMVNLIRRY